jgi:hypothetical protein
VLGEIEKLFICPDYLSHKVVLPLYKKLLYITFIQIVFINTNINEYTKAGFLFRRVATRQRIVGDFVWVGRSHQIGYLKELETSFIDPGPEHN